MGGSPVIYEPNGKAREYSPLACNLYAGCAHGCVYCYAPLATHRKRGEFHAKVSPRQDILERLQREAVARQEAGQGGRVLLCFSCDPYPLQDRFTQLTRRAIRILRDHGHSVCILSKSPIAHIDLDILTPEDAFATSITTLDPERAKRWEPFAASPNERLANLRLAFSEGIPTWISLEPIIGFNAPLSIIQHTYRYTTHYKLGKLNYSGTLPEDLQKEVVGLDWRAITLSCVALLESLGFTRSRTKGVHTPGTYYVKDSLTEFLDSENLEVSNE